MSAVAQDYPNPSFVTITPALLAAMLSVETTKGTTANSNYASGTDTQSPAVDSPTFSTYKASSSTTSGYANWMAKIQTI